MEVKNQNPKEVGITVGYLQKGQVYKTYGNTDQGGTYFHLPIIGVSGKNPMVINLASGNWWYPDKDKLFYPVDAHLVVNPNL